MITEDRCLSRPYTTAAKYYHARPLANTLRLYNTITLMSYPTLVTSLSCLKSFHLQSSWLPVHGGPRDIKLLGTGVLVRHDRVYGP
jgi:hypothetical protein